MDFRGEKRSRDTHESKTDKDALLFKKSKGTAAKPSYMGHLLTENRHSLGVDAQVTRQVLQSGRPPLAWPLRSVVRIA